MYCLRVFCKAVSLGTVPADVTLQSGDDDFVPDALYRRYVWISLFILLYSWPSFRALKNRA